MEEVHQVVSFKGSRWDYQKINHLIQLLHYELNIYLFKHLAYINGHIFYEITTYLRYYKLLSIVKEKINVNQISKLK